jgi:hypothetical protein
MESEFNAIALTLDPQTHVLPAILVVLTVVRLIGPLQKSDYKNRLLKLLMTEYVYITSCFVAKVNIDSFSGCLFYFCVCGRIFAMNLDLRKTHSDFSKRWIWGRW